MPRLKPATALEEAFGAEGIEPGLRATAPVEWQQSRKSFGHCLPTPRFTGLRARVLLEIPSWISSAS